MNQQWIAEAYIDHASFVAEHGLPVLRLLDPKPEERILDLGCGDGALTQELVTIGVDVHGVDSSPSMIKAARSRGLSSEVLSGENLTFHNEFDAVFSNAALHWMTDSIAVIKGVHKALKNGGRFVGEFGGEGNVRALVNAMEMIFTSNPEFGEFKNPWFFPNAERYKAQLEDSGFQVSYIELIARPTPLDSGVMEWLKIFSNGITAGLNAEQREKFLTEVEELVKPSLLHDSQWVADYVRLRFVAHKV